MTSDPIQAKKSQASSSLLPWFVWILGCIFYFYEFLLQVSPSVMSTELMRDFTITSQTLGILSGFYYYAYTPMQLPCGILMDKYGPHRILTLATVICAVSTIAFSMTNSYAMACFTRLMIGFGSAFAVVGTMKLAANWFSSDKFGFLTGLMVTIGMLGAIGGEAPLAILVDHAGWRQSMLITGIVGLVLALSIYAIVKDSPTGANKVAKNAPQSHMLNDLITLSKNKQLWLVAIYGNLMYMATPVFCGLWGVPFLIKQLGISKPLAANYVSLVFIGWAVASPLWGIYSKHIGLRKPPMYYGTVGALITSLMCMYAPIENGFVMQMTLFLFGFFSAGFLSSFSVAKELCHQNCVATGLGFMNMFNMIGVLFAQPFIGYVLDRFWSGDIDNGVRLYSLHAYHVGLLILPLGILISLIILPFIKETYCEPFEFREENGTL